MKNTFYALCFSVFLFPTLVYAQACTPIENFEPAGYNISTAHYQWTFAGDASYYRLEVAINGRSSLVADLSGNATSYSVSFQPALHNYDEVSAVLTKYSVSGGVCSASCDFIIVTDAVVYLTGSPQNQGKIKVEPVFAVNDNLVPAAHVCGKCDPDYFRLTSGFYGPYGIAVDTSLSIPIEQLRFLKTALCDCLEDAILAGFLKAGGGKGPAYAGKPFKCHITPYLFDEIDCVRGEHGSDRSLDLAETVLNVAPNPLVGMAQIRFSLKMESNTLLAVYDANGKTVETILDNRPLPSGTHQILFDAQNLAAGIYFCRLQTQDLTQTIKLFVSGSN